MSLEFRNDLSAFASGAMSGEEFLSRHGYQTALVCSVSLDPDRKVRRVSLSFSSAFFRQLLQQRGLWERFHESAARNCRMEGMRAVVDWRAVGREVFGRRARFGKGRLVAR